MANPPSKLSILTRVPSGKSSKATAQKEPGHTLPHKSYKKTAMATQVGGQETSPHTSQLPEVPAHTAKEP